jgi:2-phosphosulfolactate phosphatase
MTIDVLLSPAEFEPLRQRKLDDTTCVVFDVLRATSSMMTALHLGAEAIIPVSQIEEALALRARDKNLLLAGERNGVRITSQLTGSIDFDFGNSPRDFTPEKVAGRTIAWTTTNGTRALRSCAHAQMILLGSLLNLAAVVDVLDQLRPSNLLIICSGTFEDVAFEDTFAAGALIDGLAHLWKVNDASDSAHIARAAWQHCGGDPQRIHELARNGRKLLSLPALAPDVSLCLQRNTIRLNAALMNDGSVRPLRGFAAKLA